MDPTTEFWGWLTSLTTLWEVLGKIALIIVGTILLRWMLLFVLRRSIGRIVAGVKSKQNIENTSQILVSPIAQARVIQRSRAIGSVLANLVTWTLAVIAFGMVLGQLGINATAIVASAGILGAALGFGAQNVVRDLLSGLFMGFEDQLGVGDLVDLGQATGFVEAVGIRVTQVRDVDGTLWYVRNGEILRVGNKSQGWGRAIVKIVVPSNQDFDAVEHLLTQAGNELTKDPKWRTKITGQAEVWGLDSFGGEGMEFKVTLKTRPAQQLGVSRELRRRAHDYLLDHGIPLNNNINGMIVPLADEEYFGPGQSVSGNSVAGQPATKPITKPVKNQPVTKPLPGPLPKQKPTTGTKLTPIQVKSVTMPTEQPDE